MSEEIPIERCGRLPVIEVSIEGNSFRFLVDTAATSMLNLNTFAGGAVKAIQISSWKGTTFTSAREVILPEMVVGGSRLQHLRLPAVDLSPIAEACGDSIDGILGVDLLEDLGAMLDLKNRVALMGENTPKVSRELWDAFQAQQRACLAALNRGDPLYVASCVDPQVALFTKSGEFRGREELIDYLRLNYFGQDPPVRFSMNVRDFQVLGDAIWFGYDLRIALPKGTLEARGMAICRRSQGRWRLLNMHNSFEKEQELR